MKPLNEWKVSELRSATTNPEADLRGWTAEDLLAELLRRHKADVLEMAATIAERYQGSNTAAVMIRKQK